MLEPPNAVIDAADSRFRFSSTSANSELEFLGFEVYYKLFPREQTSFTTSYSSYQDMLAAGYLRLQNHPQDTPSRQSSPLIAVHEDDKGEAFTVTVDFSGLIDQVYGEYPRDFPAIYLSGSTFEPGTTTLIPAARRPVEFSSAEYKRFVLSQFAAADGDLTADVYADITDSLHQATVLCFALSFGATDERDKLYSAPVYLGDEKITFPASESSW